jgi:peptidoglycan/LPS O-acetylase OafA/YrhL
LLTQITKSFARVTSSIAYIPQIDGLRAIAMLMVLVHHVVSIYLEDTHRLGTQHLPDDWNKIALLSPLVNWILNLGIGVPIFCVISGFVLTIPFARNYNRGTAPPKFWLYLLRRLIRMEPPYVVSMTFLFLMILMPWRMGLGYAKGMLHVFGPHYLASLAYLHAQIYGTPSWISGVAWTLEIELQFYLLLPLIARIFLIRQATLRRCLIAVMMLGSAYVAQFVLPSLNNPRLTYSLLLQLHFFLAGMLLADIHLDPPRAWQLSPLRGDLVAAALTVLVIYVLHWQERLAWIQPFLIAALFFAVFRAKWFGRFFASPWLTIPGTFCYTVYLYHFFIATRVLPYTIRLFPPTHPLLVDGLVQVLLLLPPVLLVSSFFYVLVERPFVVLSHEVASRFKPAPSPKTAAPVASA